MGQRLGKSSWTTTTSNSPQDINQNQTSVQGKFSTQRHSSTETIDNNSNQITSENLQIVDSTKALLHESSSSLSSSPPGQVIIRIQLTKMENNNNISSSTENLDNGLVQSNVASIGGGSSPSSSTSSSRADNESIYSFDNNLNITCGTHSIINLTISNNIPCNAPITTSALSNNLNIVNSADRGLNNTSNNNIRCLNIVGDSHHHHQHQQQSANSVENNLNRLEKSTGARQKSSSDRSASKCLNTNSKSGRRTTQNSNFNSRNIIPNISSNIQMVADSTKAASCCGGSSNTEHNCNSGHASLCSQSSNEGHRGHCCRSKNFAYPSKLRCCQCVCRESLSASNNNSNTHNVPSATSSKQTDSRVCTYRNSFQTNGCCSNGTVAAVVANRQPPAAEPPPPQIILVQVNPATGHANLSQNFPQEIGWILPALCSSTTTSAAGPVGVQGVPPMAGPMVHSQADYSHCLVPDLEKITNCSFYWGKMDRYEAERLLEGKPEGTFLLRDSAQEEYLFSVTFRKYGRSLHARIEQLGHKFSFDCHDPGVFTASTVTGLLEHYKDPSCVMFFEPTLTIPLHRNFPFSLQQLCRATIVSHITYDGVNELQLPSSLKSHLKEYHYKYKVRETPLDDTYQCS